MDIEYMRSMVPRSRRYNLLVKLLISNATKKDHAISIDSLNLRGYKKEIDELKKDKRVKKSSIFSKKIHLTKTGVIVACMEYIIRKREKELFGKGIIDESEEIK